MKKIIAFVLLASLSLGVLCITASANLGVGAQVVAAECELIKTGLSGQKICFSDTDFKCALSIPKFKKITITELPKSSDGALMLAGRRISKGQEIKRKNIPSLVFVPSSKSVKECQFKFTIDGFADNQEIICTLKFTDTVNRAPTANSSDEYVLTQGDISVYDKLYAKDPEGDSVSYMIVSYPKYGAIELLDGGRYRYTPMQGYIGEDKFAYVAKDEYGNYSKPVYIEIKVIERMSDVVFYDMKDKSEYGAAVAMCAMGVMSGDVVGDDVYFNPDGAVTRAEFVSMAMKAFGMRPDSTITASYFDDNADIPLSLMGYVATAQRAGIVNGTFVSGELLFRPNDVITKYEAAKIMAEIIGDVAESESEVFADISTVPVWARPGVYAMHALGIFESVDGNIYGNAAVNRAECADYLYKMCLLAEKS